QMPATRPHDQGRELLMWPQAVDLLVRRQLDRSAHRVGEVDLTLDHVGPSRGVRVLEVGHEHLRARVERVDHHLALDWASDLDPPVAQGVWGCRGAPVTLTHRCGLYQEVRALACIEADLALVTLREQFAPCVLEAMVK